MILTFCKKPLFPLMELFQITQNENFDPDPPYRLNSCHFESLQLKTLEKRRDLQEIGMESPLKILCGPNLRKPLISERGPGNEFTRVVGHFLKKSGTPHNKNIKYSRLVGVSSNIYTTKVCTSNLSCSQIQLLSSFRYFTILH